MDQEDCTFEGNCGQTGAPRRSLLVGLGLLAPGLEEAVSIQVSLSVGPRMAVDMRSLQATFTSHFPREVGARRTSLTPSVRTYPLPNGSSGPSLG